MLSGNSTRFSGLTTCCAYLIATLLVVIVIYGLFVPPYVGNSINSKNSAGDIDLYRHIVDQVRTGESYYDIADKTLHNMGYRTGNVFNWRMPVLAQVLGFLPSEKAVNILATILTSLTLLVWMVVFNRYRYSFGQMFIGILLMAGPLMYSLIKGPTLFHEFWAGLLISLSLAACAGGWRYISLAAGISALLIRELALPFVCIMLILSYLEKRRGEALAWLAGIIVFSVEFVLHYNMVSKFITKNELTMQGGRWLVLGGWEFVLGTAHIHPYFLLSPPWITAIILPLAIIGLIGWRSEIGLRVVSTVGIYTLAFCFVGRSVNLYWGMMYVFIMPLGLLFVPGALKDIFQALRRPAVTV